MNENKKEKTIDIIIPAGYRSFKEKLDIHLNKGLNVITGINGSGKTQLLEYIYFTKIKEIDKDSILLRTTTKINNIKDRLFLNRDNRYYYRNKYDDDFITINEILNDIENEYKRYIITKEFPNTFIYPSAVYNAMFVKDNFLYKYNNFIIDFYKRIAIVISDNIDYPKEQILKDFGIINENALREEIRKKLKDDGIIKKGAKKYDDLIKKFYESNKEEIETIKKDYFEKHNLITNKLKLIDYVNNLLTPLNNLNGIIIKLSSIIYNEAIEKAKKTRTKKIWEQINEILDKYDNFNYNLEEPDLRIDYKISFKYKNNKNPEESIPFENLSSGEKIIFELICYIFIIDYNNKDNKTKIILLDEFDANLNPELSELLIKTIRDELVKRGITVVLTTHSPSTVALVEPRELHSIKKEEYEKHIFENAKDENGKKEILEKLAPKFVYEKELGFMGILAKTQKEYIIFVEGESDKIHFETARQYLKLKDNYEFIDCNCADNISNIISAIRNIPIFNTILNKKNIIALFDFDTKGREKISKLLDHNSASQNIPIKEISDKISYKENLIFNFKNKNCNGYNNIVLMMLTPNNNSNNYWNNFSNYEIEHLYNTEKYNNNTILMKSTDENDIFIQNPEKFKAVNDKKMDFAKYVHKHSEEFKDAFETNFKRIFDIINTIQ